MKVYIHTDIEGVAGWVFFADMKNPSIMNRDHLRRMNRLLTDEISAAVRACLAAGADEILVNDSHGFCYNIDFETLDPACRIIHGRAGYGPNWLPLLDTDCDAAIGIGMHAMAGTPAAVCPHSCWHLRDGAGREWKLSECTMFAALAGSRGVPVVAVSGDDKLCAEVREKVPGCATAEVKQGFGRENACSLMPAAAQARIAEAVTRGLAERTRIRPFVLTGPFTLNVSDRDPAARLLDQALVGDTLWETMHAVCNKIGNHFGDASLDDRSWRYPGI